MAQSLDSATLQDVEQLVLERIRSLGRVPVVSQIAIELNRRPMEFAALSTVSPSYATLLAVKHKYIAKLAEQMRSKPERFSTLEACAEFAEREAVIDEIKEAHKKLNGPDGNGPQAA